ncbi:CorA family divalent cation transporter [Cutibacterium acnes]
MDGHPERLGIIVEQSPNRTQIKRLVDPMNLDPLLAEDLAEGHQRPKLERHGEALFLVLHPPFYIDSIEDVAFVEAEVIKQRNCGLRVKMCVWLGVSRGLDLAFLNAD